MADQDKVFQKLKDDREYTTEGPWSVSLSYNHKWWLVLANSGTAREERVAKVLNLGDADFIATAPKLSAALEAVLVVHRRAYGQYKNLQVETGVGGFCVHCQVEWPCHTAATIDEALR